MIVVHKRCTPPSKIEAALFWIFPSFPMRIINVRTVTPTVIKICKKRLFPAANSPGGTCQSVANSSTSKSELPNGNGRFRPIVYLSFRFRGGGNGRFSPISDRKLVRNDTMAYLSSNHKNRHDWGRFREIPHPKKRLTHKFKHQRIGAIVTATTNCNGMPT